MADLPEDRVRPDRPPFTSVGLDIFGLFQVRRSRSLVKRYGVNFTCLAIRAVQIEVAFSLDTDSFLLALPRFIARRGQVKEIYSDNGTNFTSGERELRDAISEWSQEKIHNFLLQKISSGPSAPLTVPILEVSGKDAYEPSGRFFGPY
ncbi:uncharacterized protein [Montipora capricornis]|uniref:uncharacterized protein n=1 Tax=Montipora capricornis TaxID=246305 RepID=UPI0035F217CB